MSRMETYNMSEIEDHKLPLELLCEFKFAESLIINHHRTEFKKEIMELTYPGCRYTVVQMKIVGDSIRLKCEDCNEGFSQKPLSLVVATFNQMQQVDYPKNNLKVFGEALCDFKTSNGTHFISIVSLDGQEWVLLCFIKTDNIVRLLYFDPMGKQLSNDLNRIIEKYCIVREIITHLDTYNSNLTNVETIDTGPICLLYLEMIMSGVQKSAEFVSITASKSKFQVLAELNLLPYQRSKALIAAKNRFQKQSYHQMVVRTFASRMRERPAHDYLHFKTCVIDYLEKFLALQVAKQHVDSYLASLKEMLEMQEMSTATVLENIPVLERVKVYLNDNLCIQEIILRGENAIKDMRACRLKPIVFVDRDQDLVLQENNGYLSSILYEGFNAITQCSDNKNVCTEKVKTELQKSLGLKEEIGEKLFLCKNSKEDKTIQEKEIQDLCAFLHSIQFPTSSEKLCEQSLQTEQLHNENQGDSEEFGCRLLNEPTIRNMNDIERCYTQNWREVSKDKILSWAERTKLNSLQQQNRPEITEVIAVLDRSNEILRGGRLRIPEILALLLLGSFDNQKGNICKIPPRGARATIVAAMLATMKILSGERFVDIITLSPELAEEALQNHWEFYKIFGINVATNNVFETEFLQLDNIRAGCTTESRKCYLAEVVYGTIDNFKDDYLQDINRNRRGNRGFGSLILEEVGPLMIEDAFCMATLLPNATEHEGIKNLQCVYNQIWSSLLSTESDCTNEVKQQLCDEKTKLVEMEGISPDNAYKEYCDLHQAMEMTVYDNFHVKIKHQIKTTCLNSIPKYLNELVESRLDTWIDSALIVKYKLKENYDYYLKPGDGTQVKVVPVGHEELFQNVVWSDGILPFLQLKHGLQPTGEKIPVCSISNFGYISLFESNIVGLTCTLGSVAEQELIQKMYSINISSIPMSRKNKYRELNPTIVNDKDWAKFVAVEGNMVAVQDGRAVLIICKTIDDCQRVELCLKIIDTIEPVNPDMSFEEYSQNFRTIKNLTEAQHAVVSSSVLYPGDVVVTTRTLARNLQLLPSAIVDSNGGLHVCLGFLPRTQREKEMMFRFARVGLTGSVQIIVRKSEVQKIYPVETLNGIEGKDEIITSHKKTKVDLKIKQLGSNMATECPTELLEPCNSEVLKTLEASYDDNSKEPSYLGLNENEILYDGYEGDDENLDSDDKLHQRDAINSETSEWVLPPEFEVNETSTSTEVIEYSQLDLHVLVLFMEYWGAATYAFYGLDSDTATDEEKMKCIWKNSVAKMTEGEKIGVANFMEYANRSCYRSHLDDFDKEIETTKSKHSENTEELLKNDFTSTIHDVEKIIRFRAETSKQFQSEYDINALMRLNELTYMKYFEKVVDKLCLQDHLFHQFWSFCRSRFLQDDSIINTCYTYAPNHLQKLWTAWVFAKDWNRVYEKLNIDCDSSFGDGNKLELLMHKSRRISEDLLGEFKQFVTENSPEILPRDLLLLQDSTRNISDVTEPREIIIVHNDTSALIGSRLFLETYNSSRFRRQKKKLEDTFQKVVLTEVEQIGIDMLQYLRMNPDIEANAAGQNEIAAGLAVISKFAASVVPVGLSDCLSVFITLVTEGIVKIVLGLLENSEEQCLEFRLKKDLIVYAFSLFSSHNFLLNLENVRIIEEASKICLLYAGKLETTREASNFHSFLQRLGFQLNRILIATKYSMMISYSDETTYEHIQLPVFTLCHESVVEDCRRIIGTYVMKCVEGDFLESAIKGCKPTIRYFLQGEIERQVETNFDEVTFLDGSLDSFDEYFQDACQVVCNDILAETRRSLRSKTQFERTNIYKIPAWRGILEISGVFFSKLQAYLNNCSHNHKAGEVASEPEILQEYALELLTEKIYDNIQLSLIAWSTKTATEDFKPTEENLSVAGCEDIDSADKHAFNLFLGGIQAKSKYYVGRVSLPDCLLKYQLAYMMDTARLVREVEYLNYLKAGGSIAAIEDLKTLSNYLGYSVEIRSKHTNETKTVGSDIFGKLELLVEKKQGFPRGYYSFICKPNTNISGDDDLGENEYVLEFLSQKTCEDFTRNHTSQELWKHLLVYLEGKIKSNARWHKKIQSIFSDVLGGTLQFPEIDLEKQDSSWSDFEDADIIYEAVIDGSESQAGDMQELNSILKVQDKLQFGHSIEKHSEPNKGDKFMKQNQNIKQLSTFENYESQIQAFKACLKKIKNKKEILKSIRGMDFEVHVDASQLELATPLRMYEITRKEGKPKILPDPFMVKFITLILGYRHQAATLGMKRFFHVHTIIPRAVRPPDLLEGVPYHINIRSRASAEHIVAGMKKWNDVNERFFAWKNKM